MKQNKKLSRITKKPAMKGTIEPTVTKESRFRPCSLCGGSPDIHNTNRGADFVGHEYE